MALKGQVTFLGWQKGNNILIIQANKLMQQAPTEH
jgi:hypothetical protein